MGNAAQYTPMLDSGVGIDLPNGDTIFIHNDANLRDIIVRAVNAHDALLAFAEYVADMDPNNRAPLFEKARAVIALAKGGAEPASTNEEAA